MWTSDRDGELRRLGPEDFLKKYPGADAQEVQDRYLALLDPEGRAALLREKNRTVECRAARATRRQKTRPWTEGKR